MKAFKDAEDAVDQRGFEKVASQKVDSFVQMVSNSISSAGAK